MPKEEKMSLYDMTWEPKMLDAIMTKPSRMTSSSTTKTERSLMAWCVYIYRERSLMAWCVYRERGR